VFAVRTFSDDGGDLTSQPRGKKKRWAMVLRQHMSLFTYGRIICSLPANDSMPTSKKLILNTEEKAGSQQ
jgi:hypothetical protein